MDKDQTRKMKIGITCYPTYGGSGVVATELGKELASRGHQVHFISYAMPHRLAMHTDGAISAAWTTSTSDAVGFPGRGSGYNFRSAAGKWQPSDSNRVENVRTGWANVGVLSNGSV